MAARVIQGIADMGGNLAGIADAARIGTENDSFLWLGTALVAVGLLFKVGAVPFHSWIPDVYQGAPATSAAWWRRATSCAPSKR